MAERTFECARCRDEENLPLDEYTYLVSEMGGYSMIDDKPLCENCAIHPLETTPQPEEDDFPVDHYVK